ncbi:diguanylate cyclase domain-containing protein [Thiohalocapsa marina]|uniref:diguanylate cyclase domain-containing protein n=1 Tax=Thiohalocapsa marina TaxID=424902 RepID=UPI0036D76B12
MHRALDRLRAGVEDLHIAHGASDASDWISISISIGAALCQPTLQMTPESLIEAADRQLYVAKAGGRNRVCVTEVALDH